jgi:tetratricopeptide (TPR) repeat protein
VFHNTTARYNGYFYANEALKEADVKLEEMHSERWDETLPLFLESNEETAQQIFPLMERAIEKCTRVVDRHTMAPSSRNRKSFKRPVLNKWIDDNYRVIGQSYYMKGDYPKAEEIFTYLSRTVASPDAEAWAFSWLGRTHMRTGNEIKAKNALGKAQGLRESSDEAMIHTQMVLAQFSLLDDRYDAAIEHLEKALSLMRKRDPRRARTTFVLAQCLRSGGEIERAIEQFQAVADMRWEDYEWVFQGNIQQAMTYERRNGNSEAIVELLEEMLDNKKNDEFQDQIYYALGEVALEDRRRDESFGLFEQSVAAHVDNDRQLGKGYLKLADLYMEDLEYPTAQAYYDSALVYMEEDNKRKEEVSSLASDLTSLVDNLNVIVEVDSMLNICDMDEDMRLRVVDRILREMELDLERQREEREAARQAAEAAAAADMSGDGMFWPYNGRLRASGLQTFLDVWGDRVLEDDWRRSNKLGNLFSEDGEEGAEGEDSAEEALDPLDPANLPSFDELLASLPCEEEARLVEEGRMAEAYYNAGLDYREKLNDNKKAIETWAELIEVLDSSDFHPTAHYQLFRTYLEREIEENYQNPFCDDCNSEYWASEILRLYPGSEWARLIEDPEFQDEAEIIREAQREEYEAFLNRYYLKDYQQVLLDIDEVLARDSANAFECKHRLLRTQCVGGLTSYSGERTPYFEALASVVSDCPDTEEAAFAQDLMRKLGVSLGDDPTPKEVEETEEQSEFAIQPDNEHYLAIFIPVGRGNGDQVKAKVADFNNSFFGSKRLKVTSNLLDRSTQVVLVKSFPNMREGMDYYTVFTGNREGLIEVNSSGYEMVLISNENYVSLFKNKNVIGYAQFFAQQYLSGQ